MRAVLDACVLYPTVMREVLLGTAAAGGFAPLWSRRILDEWRIAAGRADPVAGALAEGEIATIATRWPAAQISPDPATETRLDLPDPADRHVLAAAIAGDAPVIVTLNLRDFPPRALAAEGISAIHPDAFLLGFLEAGHVPVAEVATRVRTEAERLSGEDWPIRKLMKKARMPRLGKALEAQGIR
jgi:predicted nucleic acid-binding protein